MQPDLFVMVPKSLARLVCAAFVRKPVCTLLPERRETCRPELPGAHMLLLQEWYLVYCHIVTLLLHSGPGTYLGAPLSGHPPDTSPAIEQLEASQCLHTL